jgi:hypothetical protein
LTSKEGTGTAKGDPRGKVRCPKCGDVLLGWRTRTGRKGVQASTYYGARTRIMNHFEIAHPELGLRERSLLADRALRRLRIV